MFAAALRPRAFMWKSVALRRCEYSVWDRVQPSFWHPMATLEQSLMEFDRLANQLMSASPQRLIQLPLHENDEFFEDLFGSPKKLEELHKIDRSKMKAEASKVKEEANKAEEEANKAEEEASKANENYSCYSYTSSTVLDDSGRRVSSTRRRYEDSAGRLKAVHERTIGDKTLKAVWKRKAKNDKGDQHTFLSGADLEDFEKEWKATVFGEAEKERKIGEISKGMEAMKPKKDEIGKDKEAVDLAPHKEHGKEGEGVTEEAKLRTREDAISRASLNQEGETTPTQFTS